MTPKQTQRMIEIMQKHGQDGWEIEHRCRCSNWGYCGEPMAWNWHAVEYRAVGPRKRVPLKRGMEVRRADGRVALVTHDHGGGALVAVFYCGRPADALVDDVTHYRWPNGDGTWLPIEGEPEIISMEGME